MRDAWESYELQSEIRTRFLAELRREVEALLIYGPFEPSSPIERSPVVHLLLISESPQAILGRATRIAREIDEKYYTRIKPVPRPPDRLLDPPEDEKIPAQTLLQSGSVLYGEPAVRNYRAELRRARQSA